MDTSAATTTSEGLLLEELGWLRTLARRLLADPNDAEDVVQEAWLRTHEVVDSFPSRGRLRAWLTGLVHRMARDTMRARRRRERREEVVAASARQDAEDGVERLAALESLLHTVRMLDEPLRSVVLLRYLDGHSTAEIAAALGISEDLVRKRLSRGRAALRRALGVPDEAALVRRWTVGIGAVLVAGLAVGLWARARDASELELQAPLAVEVPALAPASDDAPLEASAEVALEPEAAPVPVAEVDPEPEPTPSAESTPVPDATPGTLEPAAAAARPAIGIDPD